MFRKWGCLEAVLTTCSVWVSADFLVLYSAGGNLGPGRCVPWETEEQDVVSFWRSGLHWFSAHRKVHTQGQVCSCHQAHRCFMCEASGAHGLCSPLDSAKINGGDEVLRVHISTLLLLPCFLPHHQTVFPLRSFYPSRAYWWSPSIPLGLFSSALNFILFFCGLYETLFLVSVSPTATWGLCVFSSLLGHSLIQYIF